MNTQQMKDQLQNFLNTASATETQLDLEKKKNIKLSNEFFQLKEQLDRIQRDSTAQQIQHENALQLAQTNLKAAENQIEVLKQNLLQSQAAHKKTQQELSQFKSAWQEVKLREKASSQLTTENSQIKQKLTETQAYAKKIHLRLEETLKAHQELKNKAIQIQTQNKNQANLTEKTLQEEIQKISATEKSRNLILQDELNAAKNENAELKTQTHKLKHTLAELEKESKKALEMTEKSIQELSLKLKQNLEAQAQQSQQHQQTLDSLQEENKNIALKQFELKKIEKQAEESKKSVTQLMLIERLKHDTEVQSLQAQHQKQISELTQKISKLEQTLSTLQLDSKINSQPNNLETKVTPAEEDYKGPILMAKPLLGDYGTNSSTT